MTNYGFSFDLDSRRMSEDGMTDSAKTMLYRKVGEALDQCGFSEHPQQSLYHTKTKDAVLSVMRILIWIKRMVPDFAKYVNSAHMFRLEDWSDVTAVFKDQPPRIRGRDGDRPGARLSS